MTGTRFSDKVALVTGAGSGIGRASALAFGQAGARVVVVDIDAESAIETVRLIADAGATAILLKADVSSSSDVSSMVGEVLPVVKPNS
jgi:NAD(P)-dependent dehydrogenase (short-subunit alcohol dehydrogenase family)